MSPFDYGSYLTKIQNSLRVPGGSCPRKRDLPDRVSEIVVLVGEIEKVVVPPGARWSRSELPKKIQNKLRDRSFLKNLVSEIGRELDRATGRPVETGLLDEEILPEMKVILNSLEAIQREVQREVRSEGHDRIPLTRLDQQIRLILDDYYHEIKSSREILARISREVDPINSKTSYFEDLPAKVVLLVNKQASNHQASKWNDIRENRTLSSEQRKELQELHDAELKTQQKHAETLQAKLAKEVHEHEHSRSEAEADKIKQLNGLREEHNRRITESEETWQQVVRAHEAGKIEWERELRVEEARSRRKVEEEAQKHKLVIEKLETELRVEKARTTEKVEEEAMKHKNAIEKLEMGRKKLLGMLLKQEEYLGLSDQEIVRGVTSKTGKVSIVGFSSMVSKVTTFSEWEWREDRKIWSKETLTALVGTKQRRLKKLILGDAIWTTVYQLIFCSPFRILGKEGEHLEADWNGSFPSDDDESSNEYSWPIPTFFSEKYRWETCEAALDSLTKPSSPYGPLRYSFVKHQKQFQQRFLEIVEAYVNLTEKREQDLLGFLTEAVRMWIVLCTQRYRIRMVLPGSNESDPEKKSRLAQEHNDLKFTVAPRLQRHGNAKGEQLEGVSVVLGCDGKVAAVHEF